MKYTIELIAPGDLIYSKRSNRFAEVKESSWWGFTLEWNSRRFEGDPLIQRCQWGQWYGSVPEEYLIFDEENEKLVAMLKYSS
jgi:hypothetical protein